MPALKEILKSRIQRTVRVSLPLEGRPYARGDFIRHVEDTVGLEALEAIGPTQQAHELGPLTFSTEFGNDPIPIPQRTFVIRGHQAHVNSVQQNRFKIRLHWVPYYVSNESFVDVFERNQRLKSAQPILRSHL